MASYVIFGPGRVGASMASYLGLLGHEVNVISREQAEQNKSLCSKLIADADVIAAAIPDDKLQQWRDAWSADISDKPAIHFSGAAHIAGVHSFHPLYSFPKTPLPLSKMKDIAFACPVGGPLFADIFPGASNPHFEIAAEDRARYHALAVLSGNFASYIWNETASELAALTGMAPETILKSYFSSIVDGFVESPSDSLTGPIARRDKRTVEKNLEALANSAKLKSLYQAFLKEAWPSFYPDDDDL